MSSFKDIKGRKYDCIVTAATAIALKKKYQINLAGHFDGTLYQQLGDDPELLVNVIAETVVVSMKALEVTAEDFGQSLDGDALDSAVNALHEALTDFSPPRQRAAFRKVTEKFKTVQELQWDQVDEKINNLTSDEILTLWNSSGAKPVSRESSQASSTASTSENSAGSQQPSVETNGTVPPI